MKVHTTRFGTLDVEESSILKMPRGLLGLEDYTEYIIIQHRPDTCFRWLQSVQEPGLAFVLVDPSEFFTNYEIEISDADAEKLQLEKAEDAVVLSIVTIGENGQNVTANLAAPIVINIHNLVGMQVVLQDPRYTVKHPLVEYRDKEETQEDAADKITVKAA